LSGSDFQNRQYWESRLGEHFSLAGVGYLRLGRRYNEWLYKARIPVFNRVTDKLPVSWGNAKVLDIGSGTGFYVDRWKERGVRDITGLDLTQVVVDRLSTQHPEARFLRADIGLPLDGVELEPASFDVISAFDIFFHIVDDAQFAQAFQNVAALLKPGGYFLWSDNFVRQATIRVAHQASRPLAER
jgi:SAM-dependent methyltransferase